MNFKVLLFPILGLLFLFGIHLFLYYSTQCFFSISSHVTKRFLAILYGFLSVSFIIGAILIHYKDFIVTRIFYAFSLFWLGLMIHLLLAVILAWIVIGIFKLFGLDIKFIVHLSFIPPRLSVRTETTAPIHWVTEIT